NSLVPDRAAGKSGRGKTSDAVFRATALGGEDGNSKPGARVSRFQAPAPMQPHLPTLLGCVAASASIAPATAQNVPGWEYVGNPGFSDGSAICCQIRVASWGVPVVAYQDQSLATVSASVQAFQGGAWGYLGPKGGASVAQAWYTRLEYAADGALFLAC